MPGLSAFYLQPNAQPGVEGRREEIAGLVRIRKKIRQSLGVEFKRQYAPKVTKSMRQAIADLELDMLWVVYLGSREIQLDDKILAKPLSLIRPD